MQTALMAVTDGWLENAAGVVPDGWAPETAPTTTTTGGNAALTNAITGYEVQTCTPQSCYSYPWWGYPVYVSSPSRPITLTLREVERLRDAAHRDPAMRSILQKFTPLIEVAVTFEDR